MTSNPDFNDKTTGTEAAQALRDCIKGRYVLITGVGPASLGAATAQAIATQAPAALVLASRTASKLDAVAADLAQSSPSVQVHKVVLDLTSLDSIKAAADQVNNLIPHLDVLIHSAGIVSQSRDALTTPDNTVVDCQFFTNHLGPFYLTYLLLPKLRSAAAAAAANTQTTNPTRIVNVSSHGHRLSPVRFYDLQFAHYVYDGVPESQKPPRNLPAHFLRTTGEHDDYPAFIAYGQSKTANILHATELARRFRARREPITAFSVHPGTVEGTEMSRGLDPEGLRTIEGTAPEGRAWKTREQGAATTVVAAFDPALGALAVGGDGDDDGEQEEGRTWGYLADCQLADGMLAEHAKDAEFARVLFRESERMLGQLTGL